MQRKTPIALVLALVSIAFWPKGSLAQEPLGKCSQIKYSEPKSNAHLYRLDSIEGQAIFGSVSEKGEFQSGSGLCVALFNKKNKQLAATVATDERGQFQFANVAPGEYVLIASVSALHEIFIRIQLNDSVAGKADKHQRLLLHMREKEDQRKSFVTLVRNPALREELLKRLEQDQAIRNEIIKNGINSPDKALEARRAKIDSDNTARMKEIVKKYGWPGPELVGMDGTDAAFLLIQHAPEVAFQKAMLPLVRNAYLTGKLKAWDYALLLDRVLAREGKPQVYGMSINHYEGEKPILDPIEDEANVDQRRAKIGLPPLAEYLDLMKRFYFPK